VDAVREGVRLLGKSARVDAEDLDVEVVLGDEIGHDHALGTERVRQHRGAVVGGDGAQYVQRLGESRFVVRR